MFVPESFAYCPYLRDVADGIFRDENGYIIEKRDMEKERVTVERYYKDYSESGQIRERSVYEGEDVGIWGFNYRDRVEFQHFTKDGKDDTEMELAREKVRQRYWRNRNNNAGIGVATADEIARMKISGEETRDITRQVGEELHWPVRNRIGSKLDKIHKEGMEKIKKLREQGL